MQSDLLSGLCVGRILICFSKWFDQNDIKTATLTEFMSLVREGFILSEECHVLSVRGLNFKGFSMERSKFNKFGILWNGWLQNANPSQKIRGLKGFRFSYFAINNFTIKL